MVERHVLKVGAIAWGAVGMVVAVASLGRVNADARVWIWVVSIAFPLCAVLASLALDHGRDRVAGALLLASAATPTYFAWILNVPPLVVGVALLVAPTLTVNRARLRSDRA